MTLEEVHDKVQKFFPRSVVYITQVSRYPPYCFGDSNHMVAVEKIGEVSSWISWEDVIEKLKAKLPTPPFGEDFDIPA